MNATRPPIVILPATTFTPPRSRTATSERLGRKLSSVQSSARALIPVRLVTRIWLASSSKRFCISGMRPNALMMRTPVAISSMVVVMSPVRSWRLRAITRYLLWNTLLKKAIGTMQSTTTSASCQSSCSIRAKTTTNVTMVCRNQISPKLTKRRTVPMSEIARDRS